MTDWLRRQLPSRFKIGLTALGAFLAGMCAHHLQRKWIWDRLYWMRQEAINAVKAYITMCYNIRWL